MITVTVRRDAAGRVHGFRSEGHAGFADYGEDIVCAAVSVLTQTAVLGLKEHCDVDLQLEQSPGWLHCALEGETHASDAAEAVLETMILGLDAIARQYPEQVRVRDIVAQFDEGRRSE